MKKPKESFEDLGFGLRLINKDKDSTKKFHLVLTFRNFYELAIKI